MPINVGLSASARIDLLDRLLRRDKWWTKEELLKALCQEVRALKEKDVSDATLRNDLETIRQHAGDHFVESKKGKKKVFRYDDRNFSIHNAQPLAPEDYDYLEQAIQMLRQVKGFAISEELKSMLVKLQYAFPSGIQRPLVVYDSPERFDGMDLMQQVYDAISKEQVICFKYQPFEFPEPMEITMHPYLLKVYNNRWYLVGLTIPNNEIWICALDRFKGDPKPRPRIAFIPPEEVNFDAYTYFAEVIGPTVRKENPVEDVVLKFSANRAPYILTKPLHKSQQLLKTYANGSASFTYQLRYNRELLGLILSFGSDVEVIKPEMLRGVVKKVSESMRAIYD